MKKRIEIPILLTIILLGFLTLLNLKIGYQVLRNPTPFPSSYWDMRWAILFAVAFLLIGILLLMFKNRLLMALTLIGVGILVTLPIFTINEGVAYLVLLLLLLIAYGAGEVILLLLLGSHVRDRLERFALAILLGIGFIMILVMAQGFLHLFNPLVTWLGLAVLFILFVIPNLKRWILEAKEMLLNLSYQWTRGIPSGWVLSFSVLAILWIPSWLLALSPPLRYDEMTYHLTAPLLYLRAGGIVPYPEGGMIVWMHYAEMLYTLAIQTAGLSLPRLLHLLMGVLSAIMAFLFGRRVANARVGMAAAILFLAAPVVGYETATAYIDLFVTAYTTAFGFALLLWLLEDNPRWLLVAGILGGLGLGIKLTAGPMIVALILTLLLVALIKHRFRKNIGWVIGMGLLIIGLAIPWFLRDMLWANDPFYPFGTMFFQKVVASSQTVVAAGQPAIWGSIKLFFSYPLSLVLNSVSYYTEAPGGMASALPLLAAPLFIFNGYLPRTAKAVGIGLLTASTLTVGIMFITNIALLRYALPIFPWLAIGAALNFEGLYSWVKNQFTNNIIQWTSISFVGIALIYLFSTRLPLIVRVSENLPQRFPINYFIGRESREEYLSRNLAVYDAFQFIDSQPGEPHRVFSIGNEFRSYTKSRIDGIYDVYEANSMLIKAQTPADLAQSMAKSGYDYILINQPEVDFRQWKYLDPYPILKDSDFLNLYSELVFAKNGIYVYHFNPKGVNLPPAYNLLLNAGFEEISGENSFVDWEKVGPVEVSKDSQLGKVSLLLNAPLSEKGFSYVYQRVTVEEEKFYTLAYYVKSEDQVNLLMQIRWLNDQGTVIAKEEYWKNTTPNWTWYSLISQSPKGARYAEVYASLGGSKSALIDEICFSKGQRCTNP